jgi:PTH1 family peptidyl-tRNA hydrolase
LPRLAVGDSQIRLVAGLGNPGPSYSGSRHNIGFSVLEFFAQRENALWDHPSNSKVAVAKAAGTILLKPLTFMNRSGGPLKAWADFYKIVPANILVVLDDFALPLGRLRIRRGGGAGGHNGLESVIMDFGTEEIPRLRLGIGAAPEHGSVDYVLSPFFEEEKPAVAAMIVRAADAIKCAVDKGIVSAMNSFNRIEQS